MELNLSLGNTGRLTELHATRGMISLMRDEGSAALAPSSPSKLPKRSPPEPPIGHVNICFARRHRRHRPGTPSSRNPKPRAAWMAPRRRTRLSEGRGPHLPCPRHAWESSYWLPGRLSLSPLTLGEIWAILSFRPISLPPSLSLREVGMHACGHPDWGAITFVAGRAGVVEARGESPAARSLSRRGRRGVFRGLLSFLAHCTDAVQIG